MTNEAPPIDELVLADERALIGDKPALRARFARETRLGDDGHFDLDGRERAMEQKKAMRPPEAAADEDSGRVRQAGVPVGTPSARPKILPRSTTAGLQHDNSGWSTLGPHTVGGRTLAIVPVYQDGWLVLFAGAASGGVWRSDDDGATWVPTEDLMPNLAVASLAADPKDDAGERLFAGTGEGCVSWNPGAEPDGAGIYKSTDGWSWTQIEQTRVSAANPDFGTKFGFVNALVFTTGGGTLVAGTNDGIFYSTDAEHESWHQATIAGQPFTATIASLAAHPTAQGTLVAGAQGGAGGRPGPGGKIFVSTDGGQSWTELTKPAGSQATGRTQVCFARAKLDPGDADVPVYAAVEIGRGSIDGEIWRWVKGDARVSRVTTIDGLYGSAGNQGWYDNHVWAGDPSDAKLIVALGVDLYRSTDGRTFKMIGGVYEDDGGFVHPDQHFMVEHPAYGQQETLSVTELDASGRPVLDDNGIPKSFQDTITNKRVYLGNDGGMYTTHDISTVEFTTRRPNSRAEYDALNGKAWWEEINHGFSVTQFYYGAGNPNSRVVIAGAQDNGTVGHTPGSYYWDAAEVSSGDGGCVAADLSNSSRWYSEYVNLNIYRVTRSGPATAPGSTGPVQSTSWSRVPIWGGAYGRSVGGQWQTMWFPSPFHIPDVRNNRCEFISPFRLDPRNSQVLLAGGGSLWRTTNVSAPLDIRAQPTKWGPAWHALLDEPAGAGLINSIAVGGTPNPPPTPNDTASDYRRGDSNLVLVGYSSGRIYRTTNANVTPAAAQRPNMPNWQEIGKGANKPNVARKCLCIAIDPKSSDTYYAGFAGYTPGNLWKTTDGGTRWEDLSAKLPQAPVHSITVHPHKSDWVYVGTDVGLFASEDGGKTWSASNEGPASVAVFDLFWMGTTLVAVTYGRGVFQLDIPLNDKARAVLVGDDEGTVRSVDGASGGTAETLELSDAKLGRILVVPETKSLADSLGQILADAVKNTAFVGDASGDLHWFDTGTLTSRWKKQAGGAIVARPELWQHPENHHLYVLVASADGHLSAFDLSDSSRAMWSMDVLELAAGETAEIYANEVMDNWAYLTSDRGVYAVRLVGDSHAVEWSNSLACAVPPLLASNRIFVSARDGTVSGFHARTGERAWSQAAGDAPCQPAWSLGAVIVGTADGNVVGLDFEKGAELFRQNVGGAVKGVAADDNMLFFVTSAGGGELVKLSLVPGSPWTVTEVARGSVPGGSARAPLIVGDKVYAGSEQGRLACLNARPDAGTSTLDSAWQQPYDLGKAPATPLTAVYEPAGS